MLLSIIKYSGGAQLENSLANTNLILPLIWSTLKHPERWQIGRVYSELFTDGQTKAASGLKKALLKVKGFDFVPEDLRSNSFIRVANEILNAHEGLNNFYNEPKPVNTLYNMGSTIPIPAFPISMCAILCVRLGNSYGVSNEAQGAALEIIKNTTDERWIYYFNECFQTDDRVLYKLSRNNNPLERWLNIFSDSFIDRILVQIQEKDAVNLLKFTKEKNRSKITSLSSQMYNKIGYANK